MFCPNCRKEVSDEAAICLDCGVAARPDVRGKKKTRFTGFILSIVGAFIGLLIVGGAITFSNDTVILISAAVVSGVLIAGLILSINDLKKVRQGGGLKSYPIAGIAASSTVLFYSILVLFLAVFG